MVVASAMTLLVGGSGADNFGGGPGSDMIYADRGDLDTTINGHGVLTDADGDGVYEVTDSH